MTSIPTTKIRAEQVKQGMDIMFLNRPHRIIRIDEYVGPFTDLGAFAIVRWAGSDGREAGMTLFRGEHIKVVDAFAVHARADLTGRLDVDPAKASEVVANTYGGGR